MELLISATYDSVTDAKKKLPPTRQASPLEGEVDDGESLAGSDFDAWPFAELDEQLRVLEAEGVLLKTFTDVAVTAAGGTERAAGEGGPFLGALRPSRTAMG